jgi:hypothetical protein
METQTQTAPRPEEHAVIDGEVIKDSHTTPQQSPDYGYAPASEAQQPAPRKLNANDVKKRLTSASLYTEQNRHGEYILTDAKTKFTNRRERFTQAVTGNFAVQSLGKAVQNAAARRRERNRYKF